MRRARLAVLGAAVALTVAAAPALGAAGDPDPAFGAGGKSVVDLGSSDVAFGVALRPDGRIVLGGYRSGSSLIAQLGAQGLIDGSFGGGAGCTSLDPSGESARAYALGVQADGRVVATGGF